MSTDGAVDRERTEKTPGEGGERRMSGHKRSRSEGSTATTAITLTTVAQPVREGDREGDKDTSQQTNKEREVSPAYPTRQHNGECSVCVYK